MVGVGAISTARGSDAKNQCLESKEGGCGIRVE